MSATTESPREPSVPQRRRLVTGIPGPKSRALAARRSAVVAVGVTSVMPVFAHRAAGGIVEDVDGNALIDFGSGIAVTSVGSSAEAVVRRAGAQLGRFTHTCAMVTPYEPYVAVCEELARLTPGNHPKKSVLVNSGAEAVENAVKIARYHTGRQAVVVFDHGYHGRTNLTMALTAKNMPYKHGFGPFTPEIHRVPLAYPYRWPTGPARCAEEAAAEVIDRITRNIGPGNTAAIVVEPLLGEGGFIVPAPGFLPRIAEFARAHGIVLVADEIQTGFCRTGRWFASEHEGLVPDLVTTAKGIAGGLPLAAVTGRADIMDATHPGGLGGTYGGNPVACAAALGAIETMRELDLPARARRIEELARPRLTALAAAHPVIGEVRGRGAMLALELVRPGGKQPAPEAAAAVAAACHRAGLIVLTCGTYGNVLRLLPPLVIDEKLLTEGLALLAEAFAGL